MSGEPTLRVEGLTVSFGQGAGRLVAVHDATFAVTAGNTLCLVGESGSGKSVSAMAILGLLPPRSAEIGAARMALNGESLLGMKPSRLRAVRGGEIAIVFQDPMSSLNPSLTVGFQIVEAIRLHHRVSRAEARRRAFEMLERVRIPDAARRLNAYPHQLSGGMRQRVMIAMALACRPKVLIADEPTTALDVTVQAQILALIDELKREFGTAVLLITHDFGVVAEMADDVAVMYAGEIVESGPVATVFDAPSHGYTAGLLAARPRADSARLVDIPGSSPRLGRPAIGCAFAPRCAWAADFCRTRVTEPVAIAVGHRTRCLRHDIVRLPAAAERLDGTHG
ncbi:MAG: ABC transporter ATP-binding protein [Bauldia sp.]|nr:ABC transporter ATP-binding protein [Bauldia sp.]